MGQTCTTETCCGKDGYPANEVNGQMSSRDQQVNSTRDGFRPMDMSDSARRRILQMATGGETDLGIKNSQVNIVVKHVVKI